MNKVIFLLLVLTSCSRYDEDVIYYKNYLRDKHPSSIIEQIHLNDHFESFVVKDTIENKIWIYQEKINSEYLIKQRIQ